MKLEIQCKIIDKEEAKSYIEIAPGNKIMILFYDVNKKMSHRGHLVRKSKAKKMINKALTIVLYRNYPTIMLSLYSIKFYNLCNLSTIKEEKIIKSIVLMKNK